MTAALVATESCGRLVAVCERIGIEVRRDESPDVAMVLASLPVGERTIPHAAVAIAERLATPLVLVASESLIRPTVLLDDRRILVASQDASDARLEGALRMFLAEGRLGARAWTADAGEVVRDDTADGSTSARFRFGEVHFAGASMRWSVRWPTDKPLWLYSPVRIPHLVDFAKLARQLDGVAEIAADVGDLVVGCSAPIAQLEVMAEGGGPYVRARLARHSEFDAMAFSLTEVV